MSRTLFRDVQDTHEWAGRARVETARLSDGPIARAPIMRKPGAKSVAVDPAIASDPRRLFWSSRDARFPRGLPRRDVAGQAADGMADRDAIPPFREGNGRARRLAGRDACHVIAGAAHGSLVGQARDLPVATIARGGVVDIMTSPWTAAPND